MAYMQSPGIQVKEHDLTGYVPGVASTEAGIGGVFSWGPVDEAELISSEKELVLRYGKPTDNNFETFMIAGNFLSYSDALFVVRAADANAYNAVANTGTVANVQIKNDTDFTVKSSSLSANAVYYARFPGTLGNSLKVSVCDSANAYKSTFEEVGNSAPTIAFTRNSTVGVLSVTDAAANSVLANTAANTILADIQVGDYILASNSLVGSQYMKVASIGSLSSANGVATANITFASRFTLAEDIEMESFSRYWEFYNVVDRAPATSTYTEARGGAGDELHIVVFDEDGLFTGNPGQVLEVWSNLSRATDALHPEGGTLYYKDVLFNSSTYIYANADRAGAASNTAVNMTVVDTLPYSTSFARGTDSLSESAIPLSALARAYDEFRNPEQIDVSILIAGRTNGGSHGEALANYIIDNLAEVRRDLVVTISPAQADVVNNPFQQATDLLQFRDALRKTSYAMVSSAYKYQYDRYNDKYRWVAGCGDDAGLIARTAKDRDPWWSPAGHNRGVYKNIIKLAYNPDQADRDLLYKNDINPVITQRGSGTILYGDKTLLGMPSAFDRINVRRLFIVLEKAIKIAAKTLLFEFNDEFTRARFRNMTEPYLRDVQGRRGITAFKVVCDSTNNPGVVIDRNEFVGDIYIKPARSINFITLNFVAVGTDVNFDTVIGKFGG